MSQYTWKRISDMQQEDVTPFIKRYPLCLLLPRKSFNPDEPHALIRDARGGFTLIGLETIKTLEAELNKTKGV